MEGSVSVTFLIYALCPPSLRIRHGHGHPRRLASSHCFSFCGNHGGSFKMFQGALRLYLTLETWGRSREWMERAEPLECLQSVAILAQPRRTRGRGLNTDKARALYRRGGRRMHRTALTVTLTVVEWLPGLGRDPVVDRMASYPPQL